MDLEQLPLSRAPKPASPAVKWLVLGGIALFVASLFIFFSPALGLVKHNFTYLPYYGPKEPVLVEREGKPVVDTIYHKVPPFRFTDQGGRPFTDRDTEGKILVVDFFFTRCTTICPRMKVRLQQLQFKLDDKAFSDVLILSHTVDPEYDTPEVLMAHAKQLQADTSRWKFLTGDKQALYTHGADGFFLAAREDVLADDGFLHSEQFVLVDKNKHIRGYYDGTTAEGMNALAADLKMLLKEEKIKAKEARETGR